MKIFILVDNLSSWALPYAKELVDQLTDHSIRLVHTQKEIEPCDVAIFLSCESLVKSEILGKNKYNLVVHASALPQGKGWSPLTWQILEGKNNIPITMFEAVEKVDAGVIYGKAVLKFDGHELINEMHEALGEKINEMIIDFLNRYPEIVGSVQIGEESFYQRRKPADSELDPSKNIIEQFNLLRVVENEKYPAFFNHLGHKYILKIYKAE